MPPQANRPALPESSRFVDASAASHPRSTGSAHAPNSEQAFFRLDLVRSLQLHRRLALSIAAAGCILGLIFYVTKPPVYMAQALVYVQPAPPSVIQQGFASRWPYDASTYDSYIQQQIGNAMREDVLLSAMKKLGDAARKPNQSDEDALNQLKSQLAVARVGQTYQFFIEARALKPELAAQTANAVANSYIESIAHDQRAGDQQRLTMLREERDRVQSALDADRAEQQDLNKQLGVASVAGATDHYDQDITELHTELVKARTEHDAAEAKFAAMAANHGDSPTAIDAAADESAGADAGMVSMKTALNARRAVLISKMANLTPGNSEYKQDAAELAQINANLDQMMKDLHNRAASRIQLQLRSELERTAGVEAQLNGQLRHLVSNATNATSKLQRSNDLAADITRLQTRFSAVDEQLHNLLLEDALPSGAYVSTPADVPNHRAKSGRTRNAAVIVLAGIFFGLLAAVVRHKMDRHVYVASDLEGILGFGPMAMLPDFAEVSEGAAEEHILRLAAAIEHAYKQSHLRSWVFTGTGSGAGVTTIVTRVRGLLAAMGSPTVSVDASGTSEEEGPGLNPPSATHGTAALVTAGSRTLQPALSYQMANEGEDQTLVLTDAAPIAVSAETEYLARFADCAIVVVQSGVTTRAEVREAAATLQRLNVSAVGFVLNQIGKAKADPAFLASLDAIEKHLQSQMGVVARRTRRTDALVAANIPASIVKQPDAPASVRAVETQAPPASNHAATAPPTTPEPPTHPTALQEASTPQVASPESLTPKATTPQPAIPEASIPHAGNPESSSFQAVHQELSSLSPEPVLPRVSRFVPDDVAVSEPLVSRSWIYAEPMPITTVVPVEAKQFETPLPTSAQVTPVENPPVPIETSPASQSSVASFAAKAVEDPFLAQFFRNPPATSSAEANRSPAASTGFPEPVNHETYSAPVTSYGSPQAPPSSQPQHRDDPFAAPTQPTFDPAREEQVREAVRTEFRYPETPTIAAPAVHQSTWAQRERLSVPAEPDLPRKNQAPAVPVVAKPTEQPAPEADPDIPWWLSDVPGQRALQQAPFLGQGDLAVKSGKNTAQLGPDPFEFPLHADPSRNKRTPALTQPTSNARSANSRTNQTQQPAQPPAYVPAQGEAPERLTSRLSGLRSLLTGLGLKEAHPSAATTEAPDPHFASLPRGAAGAEFSTHGSQSARQPSATLSQEATPAPRQIPAQPEFLKPAPIRVQNLPEDSKPGDTTFVRTYKPGADFEIPTLPSKRGQYRNL